MLWEVQRGMQIVPLILIPGIHTAALISRVSRYIFTLLTYLLAMMVFPSSVQKADFRINYYQYSVASFTQSISEL